MLLLNAFSMNMILDSCFDTGDVPVCFSRITLESAKSYLESMESAIGHADTARILSGLLGKEVPVNRATINLQRGERAILAQYIGPRLPEGATELPEGAKIRFFYVWVSEETIPG